ncbi:MAG: preprotein translocase subunit YajC [Simkania sp.]|nr:preprotein translocase subunit YajC [Simkania sp.]
MKKYLFLPAALFSSASLFADGGAAVQGGGNMLQTGMMLVVALLFFYFILWRPEQKRRKQMEKQRSSLKKGDRVTAMGIVGTVSRINENSVVLKMVEGAKIEVLKNAITEVQPCSDEDAKKVEAASEQG